MSVITATVLSGGEPMDPIYDLLSLDISKEVNRIPYAQLVLLDGDAAQQTFAISNTDFFKPGKEVEIKLRYEDNPNEEATVFKGVVVGHKVEASLDGSLLTVELKDAAIKLTYNRKSEVYRGQSDDKVIDQLIDRARLKKGPIPATQPQHVQLVQYYCTDWDFLLTRAEANGLLVIVSDGVIYLEDIASIAEAIGQNEATYIFEYGGQHEIFDFEIEADAGHQYPQVQSRAWDIKNQSLTEVVEGKESELTPGNLKGRDLAEAISIEPNLLSSPVPLTPQELQSWSNGTIARSRLAMIRGRVAVPGFSSIQPLDIIEIRGVGRRFNGKTFVIGIRHRVDHNGWQTDVQFGLSAERFAERRDVVDVPAAGLLPAVNGLQIGVVDQFEADPHKEYRLKVRLPGIDETKGWVWARLASPDAGNERGYFFRPEPGDEVVVGFFNDDPRQAVVLGALYSSRNKPPVAVAKLTNENILKAIITKTGNTLGFRDEAGKSSVVIGTPAGNLILLNDEEKVTRITDQHGNTITLSEKGIAIESAKDVIIEATGKVEIKGQQVNVQ